MVSKDEIINQGFKLRWENEHFSQYFYCLALKSDFKKGIELIYHPSYNRMIIQSDENHFTHGERVWFDGYIKNKSELGRLLKMLGIHD